MGKQFVGKQTLFSLKEFKECADKRDLYLSQLIKTDEQLYNINRSISVMLLSKDEITDELLIGLNEEIGKVIKAIRKITG